MDIKDLVFQSLNAAYCKYIGLHSNQSLRNVKWSESNTNPVIMIIMLEFMNAKSRYSDIDPKYFKFINGTLTH